MNKKIKAVLFDFGGVFTVSPFAAVEAMAKEKELEIDVFADIFFGPYHQDTDHPWHQLERGEMSLEACREAILQKGQQVGIQTDLWDLLIRMSQHNDGKIINEDVVQLLIDVKEQGYQTAIVTNNVKEFKSAWQDMLPLEYVDHVIDSCEVGVRKPSGKIYQLALERLSNITAEEAVFLDDVEANVLAAQEQGMKGIWVNADSSQTVSRLKELLM